ncbi:MAG: aminoacyl-tRNA hydrolase, partial [Catenulispora sp.]|nr:aminoacyl-tRNA hydrolase [Catenulispora sp.]
QDPADFVLKDFSSVEKKDLDYHVDRTADAVEDLIRRGLVDTQNIYHAG